jgi:hypothetical protein
MMLSGLLQALLAMLQVALKSLEREMIVRKKTGSEL